MFAIYKFFLFFVSPVAASLCKFSCRVPNEICLNFQCVENPECHALLYSLAGTKISRTYKSKKKSIFGDTDLLVEYEYALDIVCGNKAVVTRRAYIVSYFFGPTKKFCDPVAYKNVDVVLERDRVGSWNIRIDSMIRFSDKKIFDPEPILILSSEHFMKNAVFGIVKEVEWRNKFFFEEMECDLTKPLNSNFRRKAFKE
jgi:hypothetical protein